MRNSGKPEPPEFLTPGSRGSEAVISDTLPMLVFSHIDSRYLTKGESKTV